MADCSYCGANSPTGALCPHCRNKASEDLQEASWLAAQLLITGSRQARIGTRLHVRQSDPAPLPYSPIAFEARRRLTTAARDAIADLGSAYGRFHDAVDNARNVIDRPLDTRFVGICSAECQTRIYALPDAATTLCPVCRRQIIDIVERRQAMLNAADDVLATAAEIAAGLANLDTAQRVTSSMVRGLAHRRRIHVKGWDKRGHPLYRVGDVREALGSMKRVKRSKTQ